MAKKFIAGGNMLFSKRPDVFLPGLWPSYFKKANKIWSQANIFFDIIKIDTIPSNTNNFKKNTTQLRANSYIKKPKPTVETILRRFKIRDELLQIELHQI